MVYIVYLLIDTDTSNTDSDICDTDPSNLVQGC